MVLLCNLSKQGAVAHTEIAASKYRSKFKSKVQEQEQRQEPASDSKDASCWRTRLPTANVVHPAQVVQACQEADLPARTNLNKASHRKGSHDIVDYLNGCSARGRWPRSGSARGRPRCGSGSGPPFPAQGAIRVANLLVSHALQNHAKRDSTITNSDCRPKRVAMDLMRCGRKDPSLTGATGGQNGARAGGPPKQSADPRLNRGGRWSGWRTSRWTLQPECSHGAPVHRTHATGTLLLSLCE